MSGIPTLLADAVTAVLEAARVAESFQSLTGAEQQALTIRRSYPDWDDDFKDIKNLAVDVVPVGTGPSGGDLVELDAADTLTTDPAVDVAVRFRFAPSDRDSDGRFKNASVDKYVWLVEELYLELAGERLDELNIAGVSANWLDTSIRTYCDYKKLREGYFLGVVRVKYNAARVA